LCHREKKHAFIRKPAGSSALSRQTRGKDNVDKGNSQHPLRFL